MRFDNNTYDIHPSLLGTVSTVAGTYCGAPVDVTGFKEVIAFYFAGAVNATNFTGPTTVAIKVQESDDSAGVGTAWTDITNGMLNGSFDFDTLSLTSTHPQIYMEKQFERLDDSRRKRYIRLHATVGGTAGLGPTVAGGFLLRKPVDTLYVTGAETQGTGNADYFIFR